MVEVYSDHVNLTMEFFKSSRRCHIRQMQSSLEIFFSATIHYDRRQLQQVPRRSLFLSRPTKLHSVTRCFSSRRVTLLKVIFPLSLNAQQISFSEQHTDTRTIDTPLELNAQYAPISGSPHHYPSKYFLYCTHCQSNYSMSHYSSLGYCSSNFIESSRRHLSC